MPPPSRVALALIAIAAITLTAAVRAHDIPTDVRVHAFLKPEGSRLRLLVRVPLRAMRDIDFPRRGSGFVDLARAEPSLRDAAALWITDNLKIYEDETLVGPARVAAARVSLPSDRSFTSYESALAHIDGQPLAADTELYWEQGMLDVSIDYPIASGDSRFSVRPAFARLGLQVTTSLRFIAPSGTVRAFELHGDPGLVRVDPRWHQAARHFTGLGFRHILDGVDHLLFLVCLVIPLRRLRSLIIVVTAFTLAHSITLLASAFGYAPDALWFPPLVETLIAASILYMALENILTIADTRRRWVMAFAFGLVHGFGFSFALADTLQFAGSHLVSSLLAFNVGVELGQILVLLLLVPALQLLLKVVPSTRMATIVLSAFVAHTAWHWTTERWGQLRQFPLPVPESGVAGLALRAAAVIVLVLLILQLARAVRTEKPYPTILDVFRAATKRRTR